MRRLQRKVDARLIVRVREEFLVLLRLIKVFTKTIALNIIFTSEGQYLKQK